MGHADRRGFPESTAEETNTWSLRIRSSSRFERTFGRLNIAMSFEHCPQLPGVSNRLIQNWSPVDLDVIHPSSIRLKPFSSIHSSGEPGRLDRGSVALLAPTFTFLQIALRGEVRARCTDLDPLKMENME